MPRIAPYGTWNSSLSAADVASSSLRLGHVVLDGGDVYWVEGRPAEGGRSVVVRRRRDGSIADATPPGTNVRTAVHEYGGAAYTVSQGTLYYSEFSDRRLYCLRHGGVPVPLTPEGAWRYADATVDPVRRRLVVVREDHTVAGHEAESTLVSILLDGPQTSGTVIASGYDFYSTPRFSPDGSQIVWLAWRHPRMPWDGTDLWLADVSPDGTIRRPRHLAGGDRESIVQPGWSPDGVLYLMSDRTGWWNLYRLREGAQEPVYPVDADCARPQWGFGTASWVFAGRSTLILACAQQGRWQLVAIDAGAQLPTPDSRLLTDLEPAEFLAANEHHIVFVGGSPTRPDGVIRIDVGTSTSETLRSSAAGIDERLVSMAQPIEFPTDRGLSAHAFYYQPVNGEFTGPDGERPPLIVIGHGGPTAATTARLNPEIQYWTSRGFGLVDVNYGGSSAYGRAYRERLNGQLGIVDVNDCVNAALFLASRGMVDRQRLLIRGRSAGGYVTLAALTFHPDVFRAGASYYGIGDLELLAHDTHKFESRYLDGLVGPYPAARETYRARSPIHHVDRLACPIIFFQGLEDRVVPPEQAEEMAAMVRERGLKTVLMTFEGEQHGFRKAETIVRCLEAELAFYREILKI